MGISKRRLEAEDADVNQELRLCAACGDRVEFEHDAARSTRFEHSFIGPFTTIWHCGCKAIQERQCVRCGAETNESEVPLCSECLSSYEEAIDSAVATAECTRCGSGIPRGEWDEFYETGYCGWCAHMAAKIEVDDEPGPTWNPERDLAEESRRIITQEEFLSGATVPFTDPRVIAELCRHPEDLYGLSSRQFEELVAHLLAKLGYRTRLGPRGADDGVDVFAEREIDTGCELVLVQCKRFNAEKKVSRPTVKQLKADVSDRNASRGLVVTTSAFTRPALNYIDEHRYRVAGADMEKLKRWLDNLRQGP